MATYNTIADRYMQQYGKTIKTCWIADVKRQMGYPVKKSPRRISEDIKNRCPQDKIEKIKDIINLYNQLPLP